jgi:hypothetical protein
VAQGLPFSTPFVPILDWVVWQLWHRPSVVAQGVIQDDVFRVMMADVPLTRPDHEILVWPGALVRTEATGHGRRERRVYRRLYVMPRVRLNLDEQDRDNLWFSDPALGYSALEEAILDALDTQYAYVLSGSPLAPSGNEITYKPIQWEAPTSDPQRSRMDTGWGQATLTFVVPYVLNYTINYPPGVE